jgi:hypothetical protein
MTQYVFALGTAMTPTNIESLTVPVTPPKSTYTPYTSVVELADGSRRGIGAPVATWHWDFLPQTMRDQLRTFCTGASAAVYIRTYTKDNAFAPKYFTCQMIWPATSEETQATRRMDFVIEFRQLVLVADP